LILTKPDEDIMLFQKCFVCTKLVQVDIYVLLLTVTLIKLYSRRDLGISLNYSQWWLSWISLNYVKWWLSWISLNYVKWWLSWISLNYASLMYILGPDQRFHKRI